MKRISSLPTLPSWSPPPLLEQIHTIPGVFSGAEWSINVNPAPGTRVRITGITFTYGTDATPVDREVCIRVAVAGYPTQTICIGYLQAAGQAPVYAGSTGAEFRSQWQGIIAAIQFSNIGFSISPDWEFEQNFTVSSFTVNRQAADTFSSVFLKTQVTNL